MGQRAVNVLEKWDRQANADSKGAVLFVAWAQELDFDEAFSKPWSQDTPRITPDGLANPQDAVKLLETVATKVEKAYGKLDVGWGEVYRLKYKNVNLPANGGDGYLGIFRVVNFAPSENRQFQPVAGDSYVAAIEFSKPVKAMALMSYGNSSQPGSRHSVDQLPLFARQQLRPVWRTRKDIEAHLETRQPF